MGIVHVPDSAWAKEATKWEAHGSTMGPGLRPYVKVDYPMMLYKAGQRPAGGIDILDQQIVEDADHRTRLETSGYRATPQEAIDALTAQQTECATLAAERTFETRRMSPRAQQEVVAAEADAGAQHLPTMPERPIRPRGRPKHVETKGAER